MFPTSDSTGFGRTDALETEELNNVSYGTDDQIGIWQYAKSAERRKLANPDGSYSIV